MHAHVLLLGCAEQQIDHITKEQEYRIHPGKSAYRPEDRADKVAPLQMMVFAVVRGPLGWAKSMY